MPVGTVDKYANIMSVGLTLSAANTLTFEEFDIGLNIFDKVGLLLHKAQWDPDLNFKSEMVGSADYAQFALTQSNQVTSLNLSERAVIDQKNMMIMSHGAAANDELYAEPFEMNWTDLPAGGILVAPKPLYAAATSAGFAVAFGMTLRLYFTIVKLKAEEYFELLESRRFFG